MPMHLMNNKNVVNNVDIFNDNAAINNIICGQLGMKWFHVNNIGTNNNSFDNTKSKTLPKISSVSIIV